MHERQCRGVQSQAFVRPGNIFPQVRTIAAVAQNSMTGFCKMNSDLIASSGFQLHGHMSHRRALSRAGKIPEDVVMSDGQLALFFIFRRKAVQVFSRRKVRSKLALLLDHVSRHNCIILAFWFSLLELRLNSIGHFASLAKHQQSRDASIKPMHQKRAPSPAFMANVFVDSIDQGMGFTTIRWNRQ